MLPICLYLHVDWPSSGDKFQQEIDTVPEIWALEVSTNKQCEDIEEQCWMNGLVHSDTWLSIKNIVLQYEQQ